MRSCFSRVLRGARTPLDLMQQRGTETVSRIELLRMPVVFYSFLQFAQCGQYMAFVGVGDSRDRMPVGVLT